MKAIYPVIALTCCTSAAFAQLPNPAPDSMLAVCRDQLTAVDRDLQGVGAQALQLAAEVARLKKEIEELKNAKTQPSQKNKEP